MEFQSTTESFNPQLNQAATCPSSYANVHKGDMSKMGGAIGNDVDQWKPYLNTVQNAHLKKLGEFRKSLPPTSMTEKTRHSKVLAFMAKKGLQQLGNPHIGECAERKLLSGPVGSEISDNHRSDDGSDAHAPGTVVDDALRTGILEQSLCENAELTTSNDISPESSVQLPEIQVQLFCIMGVESLAKNKLTHALKILPAITPHSQKSGCGLAYLARSITVMNTNIVTGCQFDVLAPNMKAKESKDAGIKRELMLTNRSTSSSVGVVAPLLLIVPSSKSSYQQ
ncbi:Hypothetical predicted protein [Paramuricea clavata]|uniref:Uncharacterized protein n=1 Tax=Paramuricea clavata TaxID=317549 RepID=A0A6S7GYV8_PARCT|nr:Hypothetical predicted protein [Paramuricea clavata]